MCIIIALPSTNDKASDQKDEQDDASSYGHHQDGDLVRVSYGQDICRGHNAGSDVCVCVCVHV